MRYVVPGYIAEGLTVLAGRPKLGKSWLALDLAIAVATGGAALGSTKVGQGDVLYLALEDNERRLCRRGCSSSCRLLRCRTGWRSRPSAPPRSGWH